MLLTIKHARLSPGRRTLLQPTFNSDASHVAVHDRVSLGFSLLESVFAVVPG